MEIAATNATALAIALHELSSTVVAGAAFVAFVAGAATGAATVGAAVAVAADMPGPTLCT